MDENASFLEIRNSCESLYDFFVSLSSFEIPVNNSFFPTKFGRALPPYVAALCIKDMIRTRQTIRGVYNAIQQKTIEKKGNPVRILYAGSGPFATLLSPILPFFTPDRLQVQLLEIHPESVLLLNKIISRLELGPYIFDTREADATSFIIDKDFQPDIIVSETMNAALQWEPQVGIMAHLVSQTPSNTIMIPERITVDACLSTGIQIGETELISLGTLLDFDADLARKINSNPRHIPVMNEGIKISILDSEEKFQWLILRTQVKVYEDIEIGFNESGLTVPLQQMMRDQKTASFPKEVLYKYHHGKRPEFIYERIN